jgi:uncharacterized protein YndB with AHSA1/START domain
MQEPVLDMTTRAGNHPCPDLLPQLRMLSLFFSPVKTKVCCVINRGQKGEAIMSITTNTHTIRLHRVLRATPERIYRAFLDADALVKWLPPHGFTGKIHHMDAKVGGTYKMSFTNFTSGKSHAFGGTYLELVPHERLRYTDKFDDPQLPGEMQTTITLQQVSSQPRRAIWAGKQTPPQPPLRQLGLKMTGFYPPNSGSFGRRSTAQTAILYYTM